MKEKKRRTLLIAAGILIAFLIVAVGTAASVFAYRQLTEVEESEPWQPFSFQSEEIQQDDLLVEEDDLDISQKGVLVTGVDPDSPAAKAGIRRGSIILEVDGLQVNNIQELRSAINEHEVGDTVDLSVLNCETPETVSVTLASSGPYLGVEASSHPESNFGFDFNLDEDLPFFPEMPRDFESRVPDFPRHFDEFPEEFDFNSSTVILEVIPDSPAEKAGLKAGDIIKAISGQEVENSQEIIEAITSMEPGDEISITVERQGESLELNATLGEHPELENQAHLGVYIGSLSFQREFERFEDEQNS
ncbi:MAG: hypothetical protein BMS9Abin02_1267 [Anaerolineae bacterium]|nr:MAG: hypothetical protein BMS9Abin02_1267 [Anaerolineae bacterium]